MALSKIVDGLNSIRESLIKDSIERESNLIDKLEYDDSYSDVINSYFILGQNKGFRQWMSVWKTIIGGWRREISLIIVRSILVLSSVIF